MSMPICIIVSPVQESADEAIEGRLHLVDSHDPQVPVTDLGVTRGDGIFEVIGVVHGRPLALDAHLRRLANSAAMLDLPALELEAIRAAVLKTIDLDEHREELSVKIVVTRGVEGTGVPICWVLSFQTDDHRAERAEGIKVVLLSRGYPHDIAARAPWLLTGAKTLSYAINKAALREAARRGADDVIFTSTDGYVLEGPSASLIMKFGQRIWTPSTAQGILRGTTQGAAFEVFGRLGFATAEVLVGVDQLAAADAMWLASSTRLLAPVRLLDEHDVPVDHDLTDTVNAALLDTAR
ncbi:4-amino-4-deoxychorismate lyase [Propionibacterium cyclohexanicum]|uniref:4-amino-4-deoxychorismate lyase n=2 Tax=Propionibacterium cyclohexanicum TaxID=64702 RepID=A0A1H9TE15_9ACTN|nr:4-amino-4-deoxychorismate lyase [Propionibacterium cyclohexanicum]